MLCGLVCLLCVVLDVMPLRVVFWGCFAVGWCLKIGSLGCLFQLLAIGLRVGYVWWL